MPRATTAAWLVMPPRLVTIPRAACMPWMSSGLVSVRSRITASPRLARSSASSASKTTLPQAAPGDAGRPRASTRRGASGSRVGCKQLLQRQRVHPRERLRLAHQARACHVDGDLERRLGGALAGARLQNPERALLHRELDVLHVAVVAFEPAERRVERGEGLGHGPLHGGAVRAARLARGLAHGAGRADAGHHVLALRVDQVLAVERRIAGGRDCG